MDILYDVVGYEGLYKINKNGEVWSCKRNKFISVHYDKDGYKIVSLKGSKKLHRLIAINFLPNPDNLPIIDHIDRNKTNNALENLRWVNKSTNCKNRKTPHCKTGYKNISHSTNKVSWIIQVYNGDKRINICRAKSKYTLEQIVAIRDDLYIKYGLEKCD
jgi:hypothetical protein